ncbi:DUF1653 domain-containing protein [Romboutsia sp.]|uniref:DUF1653 domain-containing protein n=1 Tax=Romboutsia sp. TaxID=1965302 RepID=UPI002BDCB5AD|nr:DUF1653 domain-containing protein [Romboutsia sp.]HSQ88008.1 DUF1653 domain-containing protein [Romboutsia sp.]
MKNLIETSAFREQLQWAKNTLLGKAVINIKHGTTYYVKGITVDSETLELRVVYNDGINVFNDWDRPLNLFLRKFKSKY